MLFFWEVSFNYSTLYTWNRFWRHLHGSEDEGQSAMAGITLGKVWDASSGCRQERGTGSLQDISCALMEWDLNLELVCDPMSSQKCVVESV